MRYERIVLNPRLTIMHTPVEDLQLRATYGMGFRGPQAFDEDFHISTLQGTARIVRLDPALLPERSHSLSLSVESNVASLFVRRRVTVDAFATFLSNPFVVELQARQPEPSVIMAVKRNGSGAYVAGVNAEVQLARRQQYEVTVAATAQVAMYAASTIIIERLGDEPVSTTSLLRTPNVYGSVLFRWQPFEAWIMPRTPEPFFHATTAARAAAVADLTQLYVSHLERLVPGADFNWWLHQLPFGTRATAAARESWHWHLEILPRLSSFAGFELATGCHITTLPPDESAALLIRAGT
jgi:hypothetical protein